MLPKNLKSSCKGDYSTCTLVNSPLVILTPKGKGKYGEKGHWHKSTTVHEPPFELKGLTAVKMLAGLINLFSFLADYNK